MYGIRYLKEVRQEISDAFVWYEEKKDGFGDDFVDTLEALITRIKANPFAFPIVKDEMRKAVMSRFPYNVYFEIVELELVVIAVFHTSRNPKDWQDRELD